MSSSGLPDAEAAAEYHLENQWYDTSGSSSSSGDDQWPDHGSAAMGSSGDDAVLFGGAGSGSGSGGSSAGSGFGDVDDETEWSDGHSSPWSDQSEDAWVSGDAISSNPSDYSALAYTGALGLGSGSLLSGSAPGELFGFGPSSSVRLAAASDPGGELIASADDWPVVSTEPVAMPEPVRTAPGGRSGGGAPAGRRGQQPQRQQPQPPPPPLQQQQY